MITTEQKADLTTAHGKDAKDTGNFSVQVAIATERIKELTEHMKINKKDFMARRGLMQQVGHRKKMLKYIASSDPQAYLELIAKLGLRK